jgi:hypothetical protein
MQCYQLVGALTEFTYDTETARCVTTAREMVDKICATMPYNFGDCDPRAREGNAVMAAQNIPETKATLAFHATFNPTVAHIEYGIFDIRQAARGYNSRQAPTSCSYRAVETTARISSKSQIVRPDDRAAEADMGVI